MYVKPLALLAAGALAVVLVAGCSKGSDQSTTSTTTTGSQTGSGPATTATTAAASGTSVKGAAAMGDATHGKTIFSANCASCHGAAGTEGGVGPSLKGEKSKKTYEQTIAWIHNPAPPMPKLWPSPLNDKDVADVSAYVQGL